MIIDCGCGSSVPILDSWLLRANGLVSSFCSERCAKKAAPKPPVIESHRTMMRRLYPHQQSLPCMSQAVDSNEKGKDT